MSVINTNITSMIGQSNLNKSQNALQTSMERLSSGLRINSAKDDAAGQAIANRMTAQIGGLAQAQRNANDGISLAQTAEGSLNQVNDNLQRIRELSVQAANSTNSEADLQSIQDEITQRLSEIDRISEETNFNGTNVLASDQSLSIQVGANDGESIEVNLQEISSATLGMAQFNVTDMVYSDNLSETTEVTAAVAPEWNEFSFVEDASAVYTIAVGEDNALYVQSGGNTYYSATFNAADGTITVNTAQASGLAIQSGATYFDTAEGTVQVSDVSGSMVASQDLGDDFTVIMDNTSAGATVFYAESGGGTFYAASLNAETGAIEVGAAFSTAPTTGTAVTEDQVLAEIGTAAVEADLTTVNAALDTGTNTLQEIGDTGEYLVRNEDADGNFTYYAAEVDTATGVVTVDTDTEVVVDPLASIDNALSQIDALRSDLGAIQNRFEDAITNLNTNETNLSAARSRIEDADYAVEVANMTRAQILQQAGTSVLAQANQIPQNVLSLLG
ncbi:flagellin N-terminal helical domain-containing protein [Halomonas sp. BC04]|uniref:flagellin N-terminal helical domain-containing protein n=1 Tax=Halomonas sp. BC04 TaxID=1403540 RepID=UPI0003ED891E|nr:flagellin [Halomonas sp. BC04]